MSNSIDFYNEVDRESEYAVSPYPEVHPGYKIVTEFIAKFKLNDKKCLEIGSNKGLFQDLVTDYTGVDIASSLTKYYHKNFICVTSEKLPFADNSFDGIWSYTVHEHIPELESSLLEIIRVLKPGGVLLFRPAWQCRSWAAGGYSVRPYSDFSVAGKLIKASIPLRNSVWFRLIYIFPKRLLRHTLFIIGLSGRRLRYKKLQANYQRYWEADSDACNSIDPHDVILFFAKQGLKCKSHPLHWKALFVRGGELIFQKEDTRQTS